MPDVRPAAVEEQLRSLLATVLGPDCPELDSGTKLADLAISSVKMLRVIAKAEALYGVELEENALFTAETLGDLAKLIAAKAK